MAFRTIEVKLQANVAAFQAQMGAAAASVRGVGKDITTAAETSSRGFEQISKVGVGIGVATAAALGGAAFAASKFEKSMSGVQSVSGAGAKDMQLLADAALEAGANQQLAGVTAMSAAKAEAELVKAGVAVTDILNGGLNGALTLAAAGQIEFADAATIAAQAMNIFDLSGSDVTHVADLLAAAANKSAADVGGLGDSLRAGGLVAQQTGLTIEETTGAFAAFADNALIGSDAGTSLKTMLQRLTPTSEEAKGVMDHLGFSAYDAQGNFIGLEGLAGELADSFGGLTPQARSAALGIAFGSDAIRGASVLMNEGKVGIRGYIEAVDDQGAASRMAAAQTDNLAGDVEALGGALESALIENGSKATGVLRGITGTLTDVVAGFSALPDGIQSTAVGLVTAAGGVAGIAGAAGIAIPKIQAAQEALSKMGTAGSALGGALGPMAAVGTGATVAMAVVAKAFGQAEVQAQQLVSVLTEDIDMSSIESMEEGLEGIRETLTSLRKEADETPGGFIGERLKYVVETLTPLKNETLDTATAISELQLKEEELAVASIYTATNLENMTDALGITEEEAKFLAETAGIDLTGGFSEVSKAAASAYDAMLAGESITQSSTTDLEAEAKAASDLAADLQDLASGGVEPWIIAMVEAGDVTTKEAEKMQKEVEASFDAIGEAFGGFTEPVSAYEAVLARKTEAEKAAAEMTAAATADATDSWETFFTDSHVGMGDWIAELEKQVAAQENWKQNLGRIAQVAGADVAAELAKMGPAGAEQVALFAGATEAEMVHAGTLLVAAGRDGTQETGRAMAQEWKVVEAIGRLGAGATAAAVSAETQLGVDDVTRIAAYYGVGLKAGLDPILVGVGKPPIGLVGMGAVAGFAMGDVRDGHEPQIARGGDWRVWAEPETMGEAYIPLANDHRRGRALDIWRETGKRIGAEHFAVGGITPPPDVSRYGDKVGYTGAATMRYAFDAATAAATAAQAAQAAAASAGGATSTTGLVPAFLTAFNKYNDSLGNVLKIVSGFRSYAAQAVLYDRWVRRVPGQAQAAPPGRSNHEKGRAIDHSPHSTAGMRSKASTFGLRYPMSFEPWHVEPMSQGGILNPHVRDTGGPLLPGYTLNGTGRPEHVIPVATGGIIQEDDPRWNGYTMGNRIVGPGYPSPGAVHDAEQRRATAALHDLSQAFRTTQAVTNNLTPALGTFGEGLRGVQEDEAGWNPYTMGNKIAGPGWSSGQNITRNAEGLSAMRAIGVDPGNMGVQHLLEELNRRAHDLNKIAGLTEDAIGMLVAADYKSLEGVEVFSKGWDDRVRAIERFKSEAGMSATELLAQRQSFEDNLYALGVSSTEEYVKQLDLRLAREQIFSDEWVSIFQKRAGVIAAAEREIAEAQEKATEARKKVADERRSIQDNRWGLDDSMSLSEYLMILDARLGAEREYTDAWTSIVKQRQSVLKEANDNAERELRELNDLLDAEADLRKRSAERQTTFDKERARSVADAATAEKQAIRSRSDTLRDWIGVETRYQATWGNTAGALTRNIAEQVEVFTEWASALDAARARGLSEAVIDMLGLEEGPQTLGQLQALTSATDAELAALNASVASRQRQADDRAVVEGRRAYTELGTQLQEMKRTQAEAIWELTVDFLADQEETAAELAKIGTDQSRSYGDALAAGLRSSIPGIRRAAEEAQAAMAVVTTATTTSSARANNPLFGQISAAFRDRGVRVESDTETADQRLNRLVWEVASGKRTMESVVRSVDWIKANVPQYAEGTPFVRQGGLAMLHAGERVLPAMDNKALVDAIQGVGRSAPAAAPVVQVFVGNKELKGDVEVWVDGRVRAHQRTAAIAGAR